MSLVFYECFVVKRLFMKRKKLFYLVFAIQSQPFKF